MRKYPFPEMEVGDSFFAKASQPAVSGRAGNFNRKHPDRKFTTRKVEGGTRCWRVK